MSGVQIPGLNTLLPTSDNVDSQSIPLTDKQAATEEPQHTTASSFTAPARNHEPSGDEMAVDGPPSPPSLTSGLEALLGGLDPLPEQKSTSSDLAMDASTAPSESNKALSPEPNKAVSPEPNSTVQSGEPIEQGQGDTAETENPEWQEDSSPYESSSESSSSDDSDVDKSEDGDDYQLLGPEEMARILMEMDSDEEGGGKGKSGGSGLVRTKNELPEPIIPRPAVEIKPEMEIVELGVIEHFVGNTAVIKAHTSAQYQVLDTGSVLCLQDRTVIAALADVIAAVSEPRYTAAFESEEEVKAFGLVPGTKIFYPPALANLGMTEALRNFKGTDASNWHDEEIADDEIEFSDDEKEAAHKRQLKAKRRGRGGRGGRDGVVSRGGSSNDAASATSGSAATTGIKYQDDDGDDGPYRPLARPTGFGQSPAPHGGKEPQSGFSGHGGAYRGSRGDSRGRGGRGRAGHGSRGDSARGAHSLPPRPHGQGNQGTQHFQPLPSQQQYSLPTIPPMQMGGQPYPVFPPQSNSQQPHQSIQPLQPPNQQYSFPWPPNAQTGFYLPPLQPQFTGQQGINTMPLFHPNFLAALQNQNQNQNQNQGQSQNQSQPGQQGQQNNQWTGQQGQQNNQWAGHGGHG